LPKRKAGIDVSKYRNSSNFPLAGRAVPRFRFGWLLSVATLQGNCTRFTNLTRRNTQTRKQHWRGDFSTTGNWCGEAAILRTKTKMTVAECSFQIFKGAGGLKNPHVTIAYRKGTESSFGDSGHVLPLFAFLGCPAEGSDGRAACWSRRSTATLDEHSNSSEMMRGSGSGKRAQKNAG